MLKLPRAGALALALFASAAAAQTYPVKPVRVVVSFPPGAGVDIVARTVMPRLADTLGQQFVIDNRAGASGNLGAEVAARAAPDGYTLLFTPASVASSQALYPKLGYNLVKDLEPISMVAAAPFVLVVHPSLPVKTVKELIAMAKAKPGPVALCLDRQRRQPASGDGNVQAAGARSTSRIFRTKARRRR